MGSLLMLRRRGMMRQRRLPVEYQEVEYIGNLAQDAAAGYIDTGFTPNQNTRLKGKFRGIAPFRTRVAAQNRDFSLGRTGTSDTKYLNFGYGNNSVPVWGSTIDPAFTRGSDGFVGEDYEVDCNKSSYTLTLAGAVGTWTANANTFTAPGTLPILGLLETNTSASVTPGAGRVYWCMIYNNGTLVRNYVPCLRVSDGKPGLYDLVNGTFSASASGGEFTDIGGIVL